MRLASTLLFCQMTLLLAPELLAVRITVTEGDTVHLRCNRTIAEPVDWRYRRDPNEFDLYVCIGGRLLGEFKPRFEMDAADYTLTINQAEINDSGTYVCIEDSGLGIQHQLDVTVEPPTITPSSVVGSSSSGWSANLPAGLILASAILVFGSAFVVSLICYRRYAKKGSEANLPNNIDFEVHYCTCCHSQAYFSNKHWLRASCFGILTYEMVTDVVLKSVVEHNRKMEMRRADYIRRVATLSSVCTQWWSITGLPHNRRRLRRYVNNQVAEIMTKNIHDRRHKLRHIIDPDNGLLSHLESHDLLTGGQVSEIQRQETVETRNDKLLSHLSNFGGKQRLMFLKALNETSQCHVANVISHEGDPDDDLLLDVAFGDVRPLPQQRMEFIHVNRLRLMEIISPSRSFLDQLQEVGCITEQQKKRVNTCRTDTEKNGALLVILKTKSVGDYNQFVSCLRIVNSENIGAVMAANEVGLVVSCDCRLGMDGGSNVRKMSLPIMSHFRSGNLAALDTLDHLLGSDIALFHIRQQRVDIRAYFQCQTVMGLHRLDELCVTGELRSAMERLFVALSPCSQPLCVTSLEWGADDYINGVRHFHQHIGLFGALYKLFPAITSCSKSGFIVSADFVCEDVLCGLIIKTLGTFFNICNSVGSTQSDIIAVTAVKAVCRCWWKTLKNGRMQTRIAKLFTSLCRPYRFRPRIVGELKAGNYAIGVAQLADNIFMICPRSKTVRVYGTNNFDQLRTIELPCLVEPVDMVACSGRNCLYVADGPSWTSGCVWRVSVDGKVVDRFMPHRGGGPPTRRGFRPRSMSVTSYRLLVTTFGDEMQLGKPESDEVRHLRCPGLNLVHAVETSRGTIVACHLEPTPRVSEIDALRAEVIRAFDDQHLLAFPIYLSSDSDGRMFVADEVKGHVLLLTGDLRLERVLLDEERHHIFAVPYLICRFGKGRLMVGSTECKGVQVFDLSSADCS